MDTTEQTAKDEAVSAMLAALKVAYGELSVLVPGPRALVPDFSMACPNSADAECAARAYGAIRSALSQAGRAGIKVEDR